MRFAELNHLLGSGYTSLETGYCRLSNGQMLVAVLTRMPGCTRDMVAWWYRYLDGTAKYKMWHPKSHRLLERDAHWQPGRHAGTSYIAEQEIDGVVWAVRVHFHDPSEFLHPAKFETASAGTAVCANVYDLEKVPLGRFVHWARDTDFGCEVRSRYWLFNSFEDHAARMMRHWMEEMGHLADFLPDVCPEAARKGWRKAQRTDAV